MRPFYYYFGQTMIIDKRKAKKEIEILSEFIILYNDNNSQNEIIISFKKSEKPDFIYNIYDINENQIGIEITELVFQDYLHSLNLTLQELPPYPNKLKGYSVLVYNERGINLTGKVVNGINKEIIEFLSEKNGLFLNKYKKNDFKNYSHLNSYVKKIAISKNQTDTFYIRHTILITSVREASDFLKLVRNTIYEKSKKVKTFSTDENHLLLYTDCQTDINDGPTLEIIKDYLKSLKPGDVNFSRIYLFLRWVGKYYIFLNR